jgi:hypothetical protein
MNIAASFILGGLVGLVPLALGLVLNQRRLGFVGFLCCLALGFLTGLLGPIIATVGFSIGIVVSWNHGGPKHGPT